MNDNKIVTFKIKGDTYELEIKGTLSELTSEIDNIIFFLKILNEKLQSFGILEEISPEEIPTEEEIEEAPTEEIPVIRPSRSTIENIMALFEQDWGKKPRSVAEVMKALEVNAVPDHPAAVSTYLRRLVKRGFLRRIKKDNLWHYYKLPST